MDFTHMVVRVFTRDHTAANLFAGVDCHSFLAEHENALISSQGL